MDKSDLHPQDIVVMLKIRMEEGKPWTQISLAKALFMSQSEISQPIARGTPTAHSFQSAENYVWPYAKGSARGQSI